MCSGEGRCVCGLCLCDDYTQRHGQFCEDCGVSRANQSFEIVELISLLLFYSPVGPLAPRLTLVLLVTLPEGRAVLKKTIVLE